MNEESKWQKAARWMAGKPRQQVNEICAERINEYWRKRGYGVNARVENRKIPISETYFAHRNPDGTKTTQRVVHNPLLIITSSEIVSHPPHLLKRQIQ